MAERRQDAATALHGRHNSTASFDHRFGLSPRELDVLRMLPSGKTDAEIADALFISRRTATTHVSNILGKLGVTNRTEAAAIAVREGVI